MDITAWVINEIQTNDMLTGIAGGSLFMGLLYSLKSIPGKMKGLIVRFCTSTITFTSDKYSSFDFVLKYFEGCKPLIRNALYSALQEEDDDGEKIHTYAALGYGDHYFRIFGCFCKVNYGVGEEKNSYGKIRETITVVPLTRDGRAFFYKLVTEMEDKKVDDLQVYNCTRGWPDRIKNVQKRPLNTIVMPEIQRSRILSAINHFLGDKEWCESVGIPWRLSFLFDGAPGTGKTSMAIALATHFRLPLYYIPLGSLSSDDDLMSSMRQVPSKAIVLIEDIDCTKSSQKRKNKINNSAPALQSKSAVEQEMMGITLSGLLNSIDGVLAPQGRILIMTTNYPKTLDPALTRPGRVDYQETFGNITQEGTKALFSRLGLDVTQIDNQLLIDKTPAQIQQIALQKNIKLNYLNPEFKN